MVDEIEIVGDQIWFDRFFVGRIDALLPPSKADEFMLTVCGIDPSGDLAILEHQLDEAETRAWSAEEEKRSLEDELAAAEEKIEHLENEIEALESRIEELTSDDE